MRSKFKVWDGGVSLVQILEYIKSKGYKYKRIYTPAKFPIFVVIKGHALVIDGINEDGVYTTIDSACLWLDECIMTKAQYKKTVLAAYRLWKEAPVTTLSE